MLQILLHAVQDQDLNTVKEALAKGANVNVSSSTFGSPPILSTVEEYHFICVHRVAKQKR